MVNHVVVGPSSLTQIQTSGGECGNKQGKTLFFGCSSKSSACVTGTQTHRMKTVDYLV
jgi:hypothetical protein